MPYGTDGYEIRSLFTAAQIDGMSSAINDRLDAAISGLASPGDWGFAKGNHRKRLERIARADRIVADGLLDSIYRSAHLDPRIRFLDGYGCLKDAAESLVGRAITSYTIRARANVPSLPGRRQEWHSDVSILDGGEFSKVRIACWIPLTDVDFRNGTLEVVPGMRERPMPHDGDAEGHTIREGDLRDEERRVMACARGSAVFLDSFVPHRAVPNLGEEARWSVVVWMMT